MTVSGSFPSFLFFTVSSFSPSLMPPLFPPLFFLRCLCFSFSCWGGVTTCLDCLFGVAMETRAAVLPLCAYGALCLCWLCDGAAVLLHAWWPHLDTDPNISDGSASSDCVMDGRAHPPSRRRSSVFCLVAWPRTSHGAVCSSTQTSVWWEQCVISPLIWFHIVFKCGIELMGMQFWLFMKRGREVHELEVNPQTSGLFVNRWRCVFSVWCCYQTAPTPALSAQVKHLTFLSCYSQIVWKCGTQPDCWCAFIIAASQFGGKKTSLCTKECCVVQNGGSFAHLHGDFF